MAHRLGVVIFNGMPRTSLIILGNGFDLAHGLPTSYSDFLKYYLKTNIENVRNSGETHEDPLLKITAPIRKVSENEYDDIRKLLKSISESSPFSFPSLSIKNGGFLDFLLKKNNIKRWQNLELRYHDFIIELLDKLSVKKMNIDNATSSLKKFHYSLEYFLDEFKKYIVNVINPLIQTVPSIEEFHKVFGYKRNQHLTILNFNYTKTFEKYVDDEGTTIINIHGLGDDLDSEICFGFGDEHSPRYSEIENLYENEFLKYSKSIFYSKDETYRHLLGCLSENYSVDIYGHSCGVTDRTLLKQIFEDSKCQSIHYHYHLDHKDHREKFIEINRHFEDKKRLRRIVISAESSTPCPQLK